MALLSTGGQADAEAYLSRLVHLNPAALVRLRPAGEWVALWARLPWDVLVTRVVEADAPLPEDVTVSAGALLRGLDADALPPRRDVLWRWPLPNSPGEVVEQIPAGEIRRVGAVAARVLRDAGGASGGPADDRALREALLDHVPIVVDASGRRVEVVQRLVQGVLRMGFLGEAQDAGQTDGAGEACAAGQAGGAGTDTGRSGEPTVAVRVAPGWVALAAGYGTTWRRVQNRSPFAHSPTYPNG